LGEVDEFSFIASPSVDKTHIFCKQIERGEEHINFPDFFLEASINQKKCDANKRNSIKNQHENKMSII
jgi:hypothetical protein